jgi:type I restriction enzyme S subunit
MVGEKAMSGKYKAYLEYKNYGEENWFDRLPSHWQIKRISYVAILKSGDSIVSEQIEVEGDYPVYGGNGLRGYNKEFNHDGSYILIGRQGALCGNINYGFGKFWASEHAVVVYPTLKMDFFWLGETLRAMDLNQYNVSAAQPGLAITNITCLKLPFPSFEEQQTIANFLDHETAKIDTLIDKQQQLITLLKEKRQAVISHAVTKGLNPEAPMRDSGVEWLGEVPAHWGVKRLKNVLTTPMKNGLFKKKDQFGSGSLLVNVSDLYVDDYFIKFSTLDRVETSSNERSVYKVDGGDIFFVRSSLKLEGIGRSACYLEDHEDVVFECHIVNAKPDKNTMSSRYLTRYLNSLSVSQELVRRSKTTTMTTIDQGGLATISVVTPPKEEQFEIDTYLDEKLGMMDRAEMRAGDSIKLLIERRTALISAAVTGKIDVRNWQAPVTTNNNKEVAA